MTMNLRQACSMVSACAILLAAGPAPAADRKADDPDGPIAVAIYDFRSSVTELPARGATDMFVDALVHNGRFKVVERSQLNQSLLMEKQLAAQGVTDGAHKDKRLRAARYLFEGTISEANASEAQKSGAVGVAGMTIGGGKNKDVIAVDVRVVDARTGEILDSISVHKSVRSRSANVSGAGNFLSTVLAQHGKSSPYTPDVSATQARKESLDTALRAVIGDAVARLAERF
jgi:curli biogenesis system outer membrane secretion channel CsgG